MIAADRRDEGQLLILAGVVLTLAFIVTSLTLAEVSSLERQAANERTTPIIGEWRFLHERIATNLEVAIAPETTNETFEENLFPRIAATFRNVQEEKGYDTVLRLAGSSFAESEFDLTNGTHYVNAYTTSGLLVTSDPWDGLDSGILWKTPCPDPSGPAAGCIVGVYLFVRLADPTSSMEETILFAVNQ